MANDVAELSGKLVEKTHLRINSRAKMYSTLW